MNYRYALAVIALVLGLGGCASYPSDTRGVRYQDGSYYSPADQGYGDYYYAPEPSYDYDDYDYYDYYDHSFFYGSSFYSFGGYCSARYRYCPPFWYSQFLYPYHRSGFSDSDGDDGWYAAPRRESRRPTRRGSVPVMPAPASGTVRMRYPAQGPEPTRSRPVPPHRELPAPEPRQRRSESSDSSDGDDGASKRSSRRGDERHNQRAR